MSKQPLLPVLPIILLFAFSGAGEAAPWADAVPAGHWLAPLDAFEENLSISLARERVAASESGAERQGALRDWGALLDALSAEHSAERRDIEARYASGNLTPDRFNRAVDQLRERDRWLGEARGQAVLAAAPPSPAPAPPSPVSGLANTTYAPYLLNWSWAEPRTPYNRTEVYVNGIFIYSLPPGAPGFGLVRTSPGTEYALSLRVVDARGVASPWANHTARTAPNPPPGNVTNLSVANRSETHIHWNWTNPADADYNHTEVYVDGKWRLITRDTDYRIAGLSAGARVRIDLRAVDRSGQAGPWASSTGGTLPLPIPTPGGGYFTPVPAPPPVPSCPRCEDVEDCDSCSNGICHKWEVTQGEGKQVLTCP